MKRIALLVSTVALMLLVSSAGATTVFFDTFENGPTGQVSTKGNDSWDASDVAWYSALARGTLTIANDTFAGGTSQRAMLFSNTTNDFFRRYGTNFAAVTPANIGDKLILSFDVRLNSSPITANQNGFRFGLYNSGGTVTTTDNGNNLNQPPEQNNDFGYYARISTGSPAALASDIVREPAGDNPLGGTIGGTALAIGASPVSINDNVKHTLSMSIERTGASAYTLQITVDGVLKATAVDGTPISNSFDGVYIGNGNTDMNFTVDNVLLQIVPEPATMCLLGLGCIGLLRRK
jgi:hypothetical protein